ncbi:MAG TPA: LacI family transcriptional regulator [Epulopiscium sp.]|nr:LacI family transcriptional regulator [Candidatus Epulonipiscium sp.]
MITIYDIAKEGNVSAATVSKSLNDHSDISEKTKIRIRQLAVEMGYLPNSHARSLSTKRSYNIGILLVDEANSGLTHAFFAAILESIRSELEKLGYDITFISSGFAGQKDASFLEHCRYRGVDGVILACIDFNAPQVQELLSSDIPTVSIDKDTKGKSSIISKNYEGMKQAVNYLIENGHKDIAFIHGQKGSTGVTKKRIQAFYDAMEEANIDVQEKWVVEGEYYTWKPTYESVKQLLTMENGPTAIILPDDYAALAAYRAVSKLNKTIPEDISIMGFDGIEISQVMTPRLSTIKQDTVTIGKRAAQKIVSLIEDNGKEEIIYVPSKLLEGKSVKKLI